MRGDGSPHGDESSSMGAVLGSQLVNWTVNLCWGGRRGSDPLKKKKKLLLNGVVAEHEDSDIQIDDASDSTDDASENEDSHHSGFKYISLAAHMRSLGTMFTVKKRIAPTSLLVTLGDEQVRCALSVLSKRSTVASKQKKSSRTKSSLSHTKRAKDGKFISTKNAQSMSQPARSVLPDKETKKAALNFTTSDLELSSGNIIGI